MQEYFTAAFKDNDQTKTNKFLSIRVPERNTKELYASLVLLTLTIQLHHSPIDVAQVVSTDHKTLSLAEDKKNKRGS